MGTPDSQHCQTEAASRHCQDGLQLCAIERCPIRGRSSAVRHPAFLSHDLQDSDFPSQSILCHHLDWTFCKNRCGMCLPVLQLGKPWRQGFPHQNPPLCSFLLVDDDLFLLALPWLLNSREVLLLVIWPFRIPKSLRLYEEQRVLGAVDCSVRLQLSIHIHSIGSRYHPSRETKWEDHHLKFALCNTWPQLLFVEGSWVATGLQQAARINNQDEMTRCCPAIHS